MSRLRTTEIIARDIPDAWHQCIFGLLEHGRKFQIDKGSYEGEYRLEFDYVTIHITHPGIRPLEPKIPHHYNLPDPVEPGYILGDHPDFVGRPYIEYLMSPYKEPQEDYTYGERLSGYSFMVRTSYANEGTEPKFEICKIDQIQAVIDTYKSGGFRNNQMVLQVAKPDDIMLKDPPCLRHIDTRIQDGYLHFFVYMRSWDCWGGLPANLAAIQILKEYMAGEIGVKDGEIIASSKGLHLYRYCWELAQIRRGLNEGS